MNRRPRQPSRQLRKCGGRKRPSGRTIHGHLGQHEAGEVRPHDHLRGELHARALQPQRPGRRRAGRRAGRNGIADGARKNRRPSAVRIGLPIQRCFHGMAPGRIRPPPAGIRQPITRSAPPCSASRRLPQPAESYEPSASPMSTTLPRAAAMPAAQRVAIAAHRDFDDTRASGPCQRLRAIAAAIVGHEHLAHDAGSCQCPHPPRRHRQANVSASFKHGMTIVISNSAALRPRSQHTAVVHLLAQLLLFHVTPVGPQEHRNRGCHLPHPGL